MFNRRNLIAAALAVLAVPGIASAGPSMPSPDRILNQLKAEVGIGGHRGERVTVREFKARPDLRRRAPAIHIQSINFAFDSAGIPHSQFGKVQDIAEALHALLDENPGARVLLEGHTDAVGSSGYNQQLSESRAYSLMSVLVGRFGVPPGALDTVGYGEEDLIVPTPHEDWRNRRVTLRRFDGFLR